MRAVWSFWSKPFDAHHNRVWASRAHHLLSWVLSTETAKRHYRPAVLYTDDAGARLLLEGAGLEFDEVHTTLNALSSADPEWWALGKLYAYRAQRDPFVHLDSDVYLWRRLPESAESAPLIAQNPEHFFPGESCYQPEAFEAVLADDDEAWLPTEWRWRRAIGGQQRAECCGVFGGRHLDFIQHYASQAIRLVEHSGNQGAWRRLADKIGHNILFEQYLLGACIDYHRGRGESPFGDVDIGYVFSSLGQAFDPAVAGAVGYTHLIADAKRNPGLTRRLEARVARDYPAHYERCLACLPSGGHRAAALRRVGW